MSTRGQFIRFALVGLGSNGVCYLLYLLATHFGVGPKTAMTLLYLLGTVQSFAFNRSWSFHDQGHLSAAFGRYALLYAIGYLLNLGVLLIGVDLLGLPHQWVMAAAIILVACALFAGQKLWVFQAQLAAPLTTSSIRSEA